MKGSLKIGDLANLQVEMAEIMGNMEKKLEERMEIIVNLIQHPKEKLHNDDNVDQGTHEEKNNAHVELPSMNKHDLKGFDSNMLSNQGWSTRCLQLPKIDMRKFDGKDPITWIFQME